MDGKERGADVNTTQEVSKDEQGGRSTKRILTPFDAAGCKLLGLPARLVYSYVWTVSQGKQGCCCASVPTMAEYLGFDVRTVRGALRALCNAGLIRILKANPGHSNKYKPIPATLPTSDVPRKKYLRSTTGSNTPHTPQRGNFGSAFDTFWEAYPRRKGKGAARKAFAKASKTVTLGTMLAALERQKASSDWQKEGGQYIPYPATWLNQGRWEDEVGIDAAPSQRSEDWAERYRRQQEEDERIFQELLRQQGGGSDV